MLISLYTSTRIGSLGAYRAPVVPRIGEHIHLTVAIPAGVILRVEDVRYQAHDSEQDSTCVEVEVAPANDAARAYIGRALYHITS